MRWRRRLCSKPTCSSREVLPQQYRLSSMWGRGHVKSHLPPYWNHYTLHTSTCRWGCSRWEMIWKIVCCRDRTNIIICVVTDQTCSQGNRNQLLVSPSKRENPVRQGVVSQWTVDSKDLPSPPRQRKEFNGDACWWAARGWTALVLCKQQARYFRSNTIITQISRSRM